MTALDRLMGMPLEDEEGVEPIPPSGALESLLGPEMASFDVEEPEEVVNVPPTQMPDPSKMVPLETTDAMLTGTATVPQSRGNQLVEPEIPNGAVEVSFWNAMTRGAYSVVEGLGVGLENYGVRETQTLEEPADSWFYQWDPEDYKNLNQYDVSGTLALKAGRAMQEWAERKLMDPDLARVQFPEEGVWNNISNPETRWDYLAQGIGENLPSLLFGAAAGVAGAYTGGALLGGLVSSGAAAGLGATAGGYLGTKTLEEGFSTLEIEAMGLPREEAREVAKWVGMVNGLLEIGPWGVLVGNTPGLQKAFNKELMETMVMPGMRTMAKKGLQQAAAEGSTEALQEIVGNIGQRVFDKNHDLLEGVTESAFFGALLGGGASTTAQLAEVGAYGVDYIRNRKKDGSNEIAMPDLVEELANQTEAYHANVQRLVEEAGATNEAPDNPYNADLSIAKTHSEAVTQEKLKDVKVIDNGQEIGILDAPEGRVYVQGLADSIAKEETAIEQEIKDLRGEISQQDFISDSASAVYAERMAGLQKKKKQAAERTIQAREVEAGLKLAFKKWGETFMPGRKFLILESADPTYPLGPNPSIGRSWQGTGVTVLSMNLGHELNQYPNGRLRERNILHTAAHEFGHALVLDILKNSPKPVRNALKNAYLKDYEKVRQGTLRDYKEIFSAPGDGVFMRLFEHTLGETFTLDMPFEMAADLVKSKSKEHADALRYITSFREWHAQQMAKREAARPEYTGKYFRKVRKKLQQFFKRYGDRFAPNLIFDEWIELRKQELEIKKVKGLLKRLGMQEEATAAVTPENVTPFDHHELTEETIDKDVERYNSIWGGMTQKEQAEAWMGAPPSKQDRKNLDRIDAARDADATMKGYWMTLKQAARRNPNIPGFSAPRANGGPGYVAAVEEWNMILHTTEMRTEKTVKRWRKLGKEQAHLVGEFAVEMDRLSFQEKHKFGDVELATKARAMGVTDEGFAFYKHLVEEFDNNLDVLHGVLIDRARHTLDDGTAEGEAKFLQEQKDIARKFREIKERNYFPASRFGDYTVELRAKFDQEYKGRFVEKGGLLEFPMFESEKDAKKAAEKLSGGPNGRAVVDKLTPNDKFYIGMPEPLLQQIREMVPEEHRQSLERAILQALPGQKFVKRMGGKKGVAGASPDVMRSYTYYSLSFAKHLARVKWQQEMTLGIQEMENSKVELKEQGLDTVNRSKLIEYSKGNMDYILNPPEEWTPLSAFSFNYYLAGIPSKMVLNLSQVPIVGLPYLAARHGDVKASAKILSAIPRAVDYVLHPDKYPQHYTDAVKHGIDYAYLHQSFAHEVAAVNLGDSINDGTSSVIKSERARAFMRGINQVGSYLWDKSEKYGRRIMHMASYELYLEENPGDYTGARDYAQNTVQESFYEYARWNRPPFMRGKMKPFLVFYSHIQHMLEQMFGRYPETWRIWMMIFVIGGFQALPGMDDIQELLTFIARRVNKQFGYEVFPADIKQWVRSEVYNILGEILDDPTVATDLALNGTSSYSFGLSEIGNLARWVGLLDEDEEIPILDDIPRTDLHGSLGLDRVLPISPGVLNAPTFNDFVATATVQGSGAGFGIMWNVLKAAYDTSPDPAHSWALLAPQAFANPLRALSYYRNEQALDKQGNPIADFDLTDQEQRNEIIAQSLGFTPRRINAIKQANWAAYEVTQYYAARRDNLRQKLFFAIMNEDEKAHREAIRFIRQYNESVPHPGLRISAEDLPASMEARMKNRVRRELRIPRRKGDIATTREIQQTFPQ